jgi:hypothetical protein
MKSVFILLVLICIFYEGNAQHFAIANNKNNILYLGLYNPLSISAENCHCSQLVVKTNNGKVTGSNCQYTYTGKQYGIADIILYKKTGNKLKEIGRSAFWVKRIPAPVFRIAAYGGNYQKAKTIILAGQEYARADYEGLEDYDIRCSIDSFNVTILYVDSVKTKTFFNTSNKLSDPIRAAIAALKNDDIIIFDRIYITGPDGSREIDPLILKIEN